MGMPTLIADAPTPAISIADVNGVKVAGLLVQAGATESPTLIEVGPAGAAVAHTDNPTSLHDVYCRVGGAAAGTAASCMIINSHDVIADNLWLWRADHGTGVGWTSNPRKNGLVVNGDNVSIHGSFVEHFQEYQTLWNGNALPTRRLQAKPTRGGSSGLVGLVARRPAGLMIRQGADPIVTP